MAKKNLSELLNESLLKNSFLEQEIAKLKEDHNTELEKLKKELKQANDLKEMYSKNCNEHKEEIQELHNVFDTVEGVIKKRNEETYTENSLNARFVSFLLSRRPS